MESSIKSDRLTKNVSDQENKNWTPGEQAAEFVTAAPVLAISGSVAVLAVLGFFVCRVYWRRRFSCDAGTCTDGRTVERGDIETGPYAWPKNERIFFITTPDKVSTSSEKVPTPLHNEKSRFLSRDCRYMNASGKRTSEDIVQVHASKYVSKHKLRIDKQEIGENVLSEGIRRFEVSEITQTERNRVSSCLKDPRSRADHAEHRLEEYDTLRGNDISNSGKKLLVKTLKTDLKEYCEEPHCSPSNNHQYVENGFNIDKMPEVPSTTLATSPSSGYLSSDDTESSNYNKEESSKKSDVVTGISISLTERDDVTVVLNGTSSNISEAKSDDLPQNNGANIFRRFPDYVFVKKSISDSVLRNRQKNVKEIGAGDSLGAKKDCEMPEENIPFEICNTAKKIHCKRDESSLLKGIEEFNEFFVALLQIRMTNGDDVLFPQNGMNYEGKHSTVYTKDAMRNNIERRLVIYVRNHLRETLLKLNKNSTSNQSTVTDKNSQNNLPSNLQKSTNEKSYQTKGYKLKTIVDGSEVSGRTLSDRIRSASKNLCNAERISKFISQIESKHLELIVSELDGFNLIFGMFRRLFYSEVTVEEVEIFSKKRDELEKRIFELLELNKENESESNDADKLTEEQICFVILVHWAFIKHDKASYNFLVGGMIGCLEYSFVYSVYVFEKEELAQKKRFAEAKAEEVRQAGIARAARRLSVRGGRGPSDAGARARPRARQDDAPSSVHAPAPAQEPAGDNRGHRGGRRRRRNRRRGSC